MNTLLLACWSVSAAALVPLPDGGQEAEPEPAPRSHLFDYDEDDLDELDDEDDRA